MKIHKNALLTPLRRVLLAQRIEWAGLLVEPRRPAACRCVRRIAGWGGIGRGIAFWRTTVPDHTNVHAGYRPHRPQRWHGCGTSARAARPLRALSLTRSTVGLLLRRPGLGKLDRLEPRPLLVALIEVYHTGSTPFLPTMAFSSHSRPAMPTGPRPATSLTCSTCTVARTAPNTA